LIVKRDRFLHVLRSEAKALGLEFRVDRAAGKGSHYRVYAGRKFSTVQSGDLTPLMMRTIRRQLGLE
jgi:hypothetical protein